MSSETSCSSVERSSPLVAVGSLVLPRWWLACVSTALHFARSHSSPTLHTSKRAKRISIYNICREQQMMPRSIFVYGIWAAFVRSAPPLPLSSTSKASLMELVMHEKLLGLGLARQPSFGPKWTKIKLALLSLNRKARITASAIPLPGTHPRSRAESPSSRWLSESLSYPSRWHCSNLMQESF